MLPYPNGRGRGFKPLTVSVRVRQGVQQRKAIMFTTNHVDNYPVLRRLNKYLPDNAYIAGGVFKNILEDKPFRDVDVYFHTEMDFDAAVDAAEVIGHPKVYSNDRVTAFKVHDVTVEYIRYKFGTPAEILEEFDFTITKAAYGALTLPPSSQSFDALLCLDELLFMADGEPEPPVMEFVHHSQFFEHLHQRRLVIEGTLPMPISTFERTYKYTRYGFNLCRDSKVTLLTAIMQAGTVVEDNDLSAHLSASLYAGID